MLLGYSDCEQRYGNAYQIKQALDDKLLYRIERGIYADKPYVSELDVIQKKYPMAIFTMDSAFFYHGLTTTIPDGYYIATPTKAARFRDRRIKQQFYVPNGLFLLGVMEMVYQGSTIRIYNRERMLIELMRYKKKLPYDYYKEIVHGYRDLAYKMDIENIEKYAEVFPKSNIIWQRLMDEIF